MASRLGLLLLLGLPAGILAADNNATLQDAALYIGPGTGCVYEGVRYKTGQAVPVQGEPCLRCRCRRGAPVCRLRVCAPQPDPPPRGCVTLHRANTCCPELHCPAGPAGPAGPAAQQSPPRSPVRYRTDSPSRGCYLNGSLFAEGSALSSSSLCDYCYCVRGEQRCVRPQCVLPAPGCTPEYREHTCCPTSYRCGGTPGTPAAPRLGCVLDGRRYHEGAQVKSAARGRCESCFCMRGQVRCAPLKCDLPPGALSGCHPVSIPGRCCPVSYDCSKSRVSITKTVSSSTGSSLKSKISSGRPSIWENSVRSLDARSNREISTKNISKSSTPTDQPEHFQSTTGMEITTDDIPTTTVAESSHDMSITLNTKLDLAENENHAASKLKNKTKVPEKNKILPVIEAMINKTRQKDQDYDYDYNEPSLPPSLPNLRIIPFVAADAVVMEDKSSPGSGQDLPETSHGVSLQRPQDKIDTFFDFFSPPAETEGGFVPKHPLVDGPFYQANNYSPQAPPEVQTVSTKPEKPQVTVKVEAVTPAPQLGNIGSEPCVSSGRRYRHGELLSGMGACRMCFCFDGSIVCQEPSCGSVPPGCRRAAPRDADQCCGSIVCADEDRETPILFTDVPQRVHSKVPENTVERFPVIEPIPDLVPVFNQPPTVLPQVLKHSLTTTTQRTTTSTTSTTTKPITTSTSPRSTTTEQHPATTPRSATTPARQSTTPFITSVRTTPKPTLRPKTTPKPWSSKKTSTPAPTSTKAPVMPVKNMTTSTTTTTTILPSTTTKATTTTTEKVATTAKITTAAKTTVTSTTPKTTPAMSILTTSIRTAVTTASTQKFISSLPTTATTTSIPTTTTTRSTSAMSSLFAGLWGDEDESTNEAQDKVDTDVEYHDFVSSNQHNKPPVEDDDDSFSFDKLLELFISPDPPTTVQPILSSTLSTTRATRTTPRTLTTTQRPAPPMNTSAMRASTTIKPTTTTGAVLSRLNERKPGSTSTHSPPRKPALTILTSKTTAKPPLARTTQRPAATTTKRAVVTTPKPKPTTVKTTPTRLSSKPASELRGGTSSPQTPTTRWTTTPPTPSTTPAVLVNTVPNERPPLPNKNKVSVQLSSYPAQMHHLSTRRPPGPPGPQGALQGSTTTHRPSAMLSDPAGLSGLLKLAGCNIYGRMYRVGRIIQELSGPCLECRCTEVGVQCQQLVC